MERLLNILTTPGTQRVWILNRKYCPHQAMLKDKACVVYSYEPVGTETPFSLDTISNIESFNYKTYVQSYKEERKEILDYDAQEMRIMAVWNFYKNVRKDDVMLFVHGNEIEGYYLVTADTIEIEKGEDFCAHTWGAETVCFDKPLTIERRFGSPYFKLIGDFRKEIIVAIKKIVKVAQ